MNLRSSAVLLSVLAATPLAAQEYDVQVVTRGLHSPTGIAVTPSGTVYLTEVPVPGTSGGANRVARLDAGGTLTTISSGEPEPVNLAADDRGNLYWTCRTAGVIRRRDRGGSVRTWQNGLASPTGISAPPGSALVYFTQVPTPGTPGSRGGSNSVEVRDSHTGRTTTLSSGEPEPVDVVADADGNAYWTCRTAGVILHYDAASDTISRLLTGLDAPTGIAMDAVGGLYFTEVPSPGMPQTDNKVWRFDLARRALNLISMGEPEPVDIAVTMDGSRVYWTCRSAGVLLMATPGAARPMISGAPSVSPGMSAVFALRAPGDGGSSYFAASSLGLGPIQVGNRLLALEADPLLIATIGQRSTPLVTGYLGVLDPNGTAAALLAIPPLQALEGLQVHTAFGVLDPTAPMGIGGLSDTQVVRVR